MEYAKIKMTEVKRMEQIKSNINKIDIKCDNLSSPSTNINHIKTATNNIIGVSTNLNNEIIDFISNIEVNIPENGGIFDPDNDERNLFGGDQGALIQNIEEFINDAKVREIISKYYPDYTDEDLELLFSRMSSVGCGYIASINTLFQEYLFHNEIDFYNRFAFPPYDLALDETTGKVYKDFNYEYLFLDFFLYYAKNKEGFNTIEEVYGNQEDIISGDLAVNGDDTPVEGMNGAISIYNMLNTFQEYLEEKGIDVTVTSWLDIWYALKSKNEYASDISKFDKVVAVIRESLKEGKQIVVSDSHFNLYYPYDKDGNGLLDDIAYSDVGGHALTVVGITDSNQLIVSSWGHEYVIDITDCLITSVTIIEYNNFSDLDI